MKGASLFIRSTMSISNNRDFLCIKHVKDDHGHHNLNTLYSQCRHNLHRFVGKIRVFNNQSHSKLQVIHKHGSFNQIEEKWNISGSKM